MKFGALLLHEAEGAILAHAVKQGGLVLKKGTILARHHIDALTRAGVASVVAARLEPGDVGEDAAAHVLAQVIAGPGVRVEAPFTGRSNLFADQDGLLLIDTTVIDAVNAVDEAITLATLDAYKPVVAGEMVATVKIIPFSVPEALVSAARSAANGTGLRVAPYVVRNIAVISTQLPGLKPSVIDKTLRVMAERLGPAAARIMVDERVPHDAAALAAALARIAPQVDLTIIFGASAITDRNDVIPAAIMQAGGEIEHFGMPVDPGNLLLIGDVAGRPVLGAPGCARSPRLNGFDWVLQRLLAGVPVRRADIQRLGVGGLLMEIVSRPQPRTPEAVQTNSAPGIAVLVLAAGRSTRMGPDNKLLAEVGGKPLVRHTVEAALQSGAGSVTVVLGHQAEAVKAALGNLPVSFVTNPAFAEGLSTSLRAGLAAIDRDARAVIVVLGDMPRVAPLVLNRLAAAFAEQPDALAVVPTVLGERGNPVLLTKALLPALETLTGDVGARKLLEAAGDRLVEIAVDDPGIAYDVDTPEALARLRDQ